VWTHKVTGTSAAMINKAYSYRVLSVLNTYTAKPAKEEAEHPMGHLAI
jgi:hypothetical protein